MKRYKLVRLYLDDVEEIERSLRAVSDPDAGMFQFSNGTWEAETIAELVTKGEGPFNEFEMKRSRPGLLTIEIRRYTTSLYTSDANDLQLRGAYARIDSILTAAQRPLVVRCLYSEPAWMLLGGIAAIAAVAAVVSGVIVLRGDGPPWWTGLSLSVFALSLVAGWHHYRTTIDKNGLVYLVPKSARPNFFQRKRDDLAMLVIGGVFGSLLTVLVQRL